ncbi:MAG TPA: hypothetical protein VMN81_01275 [Vicinamibacterales bacterium]|nr:hypothetical protein [Vicinamibacterales bacterium]
MEGLDRRTFLAGLTGGLVGAGLAAPMRVLTASAIQAGKVSAARGCGLEIAAPFVVSDPALGLSTELLLTAANFPGSQGFRDAQYGTEYEVMLYDAAGREVSLDGSRKQVISAMRPTIIDMDQVLDGKPFWGSARLKLTPRGENASHSSDLFSAGFVRWHSAHNFDNVHAHPIAPDDQRGRFFYSMPFPALDEYHCALALFNPNDDESAGVVRVVDRLGRTVGERRYRLGPRQSTLYSLSDMKPAASPGEALAPAAPDAALRAGGVVAVINDSEAISYGYTFIKGRAGGSFSVEHPLHFQDVAVKPARPSPFGPAGNFTADALLFTPMLFAGCRIGGVALESRVHLSASQWLEEALWLMPFAAGARGNIDWKSDDDPQVLQRVRPAELVDQGVVRLGPFQSCVIDAARLPLPAGYSGGFGVATVPRTSHSLLKIEVRAKEWGRVCFTHFRPGGASHKRYQLVTGRGGLASDYIVSGCQVRGSAADRRYDCVLAVMNIGLGDNLTGAPRIQLFSDHGLVGEKLLGDFPELACRHYLLSELFPELQTEPDHPLTARLVEDTAPMIMSALHLDYERRDIAMDHGSDRHSTYLDYDC